MGAVFMNQADPVLIAASMEGPVELDCLSYKASWEDRSCPSGSMPTSQCRRVLQRKV